MRIVLVATVCGIVTFNMYFFALGVAVVALFWIWDRMNAAAQPATESTDGEPDATHTESFDPHTE